MDETIFIISPHPDDEVLGCGGTIVKKIQEGFNVKIIYLSYGEYVYANTFGITSNPTPKEMASIRKDEALKAADVLGLRSENLKFLGIKDCGLKDAIESTTNVLKKIIKNEPLIKEIYLPHVFDRHIDHSTANVIVKSILKDLGMQIQLFQYIIWNKKFSMKLHYGKKITIDILNQIDIKKMALKEYASQTGFILNHQKIPMEL